MTDADFAYLDTLDQQLAIVRDRVRGVASGHYTGFYLYGRPGTSKTFTVCKTLDEEGIRYHYHAGHITPMGLFQLLESHPEDVIVLDDVAQIFQSDVAKQLFLAALGNPFDAAGNRKVTYRRQGEVVEVLFRGGIIAISNLDLPHDPMVDAIRSRVHTHKYDPSDGQIASLMKHIAAQGFHFRQETMSVAECEVVVDHLLRECDRLGCRPDIRLLVDKGFMDYLLWRAGESESHWQDLITATLNERLVELKHPTRSLTRRDKTEQERALAIQIAEQHDNRADRIAAWEEATGKTERTFYRHLEKAGIAA